jgi:hypothetical protein
VVNSEIINERVSEVIKSPNSFGGFPTSYNVHYTAERVMFVFGLFPGQHREAMKDLIDRQTASKWVEDESLAILAGAEFVIGLPENISALKERLKQSGIEV